MSDWDFLYEMRDRGYSADDIALAAGVGYAPWEEVLISREWVDEELKVLGLHCWASSFPA